MTGLLYFLGKLTTTAAPFLSVASYSVEYYRSILRAAEHGAEASTIQTAVVVLIRKAGRYAEGAYEGLA